MEQDDLKRILHGDIEHIDNVDERDIALNTVCVKVYPNDVRKLLNFYLSKKIIADQLISWAGFLCIRTEYCCPDYLDDTDYYDDMWVSVPPNTSFHRIKIISFCYFLTRIAAWRTYLKIVLNGLL